METPLLHPKTSAREADHRHPRPVIPFPGSHPTTQRPNDPITPLPPLWRWLEEYFQRAYRIAPVSTAGDCLLAYNRFRYRGPDVQLGDGTLLRAGDAVAEIHFRREALLPLAGLDPARAAIQMLKLADRDFPVLARRLEEDPELRDVRALHALTLFHGAAARYGFRIEAIREPHLEWWFTTWQRQLLLRDHRAGEKHARQIGAGLVARHIWLSREALIQRCAARAERGRPGSLSGSGR